MAEEQEQEAPAAVEEYTGPTDVTRVPQVGDSVLYYTGSGDSEAAVILEVDPERVEHVKLELVNVPADGARFAWAHHSSHRPGYWGWPGEEKHVSDGD